MSEKSKKQKVSIVEKMGVKLSRQIVELSREMEAKWSQKSV